MLSSVGEGARMMRKEPLGVLGVLASWFCFFRLSDCHLGVSFIIICGSACVFDELFPMSFTI